MKNLYPTIHKLLVKSASNEELLKLLTWINQSVSNKIEYLVAEDIWSKSMDYMPKVTFEPPSRPFSKRNPLDMSS